MNTNKTNPALSDIFRTAIEQAAPKPTAAPPSVVVNGNSNIVSYGGTVHVRQADAARREPRQ